MLFFIFNALVLHAEIFRRGKTMYIGDLHIHSRYSRATSRDCTPEYLDLWARKKGIVFLLI